MSLDDPMLVAFEGGTIDPDKFHHREHLYVAWCYLRALPLEEVIPRYVRSLRALTRAAGASHKYHATMTWAFLAAVDNALRESGATTFDMLLQKRPELLDRNLLEHFYSLDELANPRARAHFVLPRGAGG